MHVAGVAVLAVCVFGQIPAVLYLSRYFERDDEVPPCVRFWNGDEGAGTTGGHPATGHWAETVETDYTRCRECGAGNGPAYTFCRRCQARL